MGSETVNLRLRGESRSSSRPDTQTAEFPRAGPGVSDMLSCDSPLSHKKVKQKEASRGVDIYCGKKLHVFSNLYKKGSSPAL